MEVPVLLQYELTEDAIEKCLDQSRFGNKSADVGDSNNNVAEGANGSFCSPTERPASGSGERRDEEQGNARDEMVD